MVLAGYADYHTPDLTHCERPLGEAEHVVWSVPPPAAAGLVDRPSDWADLDVQPRRE